MVEEKLIGEIVQTEPGKYLYSNENRSVDFQNPDGTEAEYINERKDQSSFFRKDLKYQDYFTWQLLKSHLSITTKVVHATQKEMAAKVEMRPATFSESLKRLQEKNLVRPYQSTENCAKGFVLNPYYVTIGQHYKMWKVWFEAGDQIKKKTSAAELEAKQAAEDEKYADLVESAQAYIADGMDVEEAANAVTLDEEEFCAVMNRLRPV